MATDVVVPDLGESITEATILKWYKQAGETVAVDETLVELETEKITVEVPAPSAGVVAEITADAGADVAVGQKLCVLENTSGKTISQPTPSAAVDQAPSAAAASPEGLAKAAPPKLTAPATPETKDTAAPHLSPAVAKAVAENNLDASKIPASGPKGNIVKADVVKAASQGSAQTSVAMAQPEGQLFAPAPDREEDIRGEERVKMSRLRKAIAGRLKSAQNTAAMLTTFNEIDMGALMDLRKDYKETFEKKHQVKLGFMSFFVKAVVQALQELPSVNAEIYGDEIIYKNYYDIGIAVGTPQGLVVPVLRDADKHSFADIERSIADFGRRARDGKLTLQEMSGGTYTITNGGVFGSLMSTPILNPPQSGILGMHKILKRPICKGEDIIVGNMMYVAHSYDHRIIDGREAVTFLVRVKEMLEDPARLLIDV